jgi:hypothetical protein
MLIMVNVRWGMRLEVSAGLNLAKYRAHAFTYG